MSADGKVICSSLRITELPVRGETTKLLPVSVAFASIGNLQLSLDF